MNFIKISALCVCTLLATSGIAQQKNALKINATGAAFRNFGGMYERHITQKLSVGLSANFMPEGSIPIPYYFDAQIKSNSADVSKILEEFQVSSTTFTPEIRYYLGKGFTKGFYVSAFYRYSKFTTKQLNFYYTDILDRERKFTFVGDLTANSGGITIGAQFPILKFLTLDWQIIGAHFGSSKGFFESNYSQTLTPFEQNEAQKAIEDTEIPYAKIDANVGANRTTLDVKGPWGGIRASVSIGFRF